MGFEITYANAKTFSTLKTLKEKRSKMYSVVQLLNWEGQAMTSSENGIVSLRTKAAVQKSTGVSQHLL